jgi:hypothetical protein
MLRKNLPVIGIVLLLFLLQSCAQKPEESLLKRYFHAVSLNDVTTMSTMALEPVALEATSWKIVKASEENINPANLPELEKMEKDYKKKLEEHVGPTVDADDALYGAKEKLRTARTRAARSAAQREVDAAQVKFDEEREIHRQLQRNYNEAKAAAAREEEISTFSLGAGDLPNIREMQGEVHSMEVEVMLETKTGAKNYSFWLRRYNLRDETLGRAYRGRWIIVVIEPLS